MTSRRQFIGTIPVAAAVLLTARAAHAVPVDEKDPQAAALGYVTDATKADKTKYKTYVAGQACGSCALYQGAPGAATGACPLFAGKEVTSKSWCSAYAKKA